MITVRQIAERLSRGVVIRRRLPAAFGRRALYVSPDAALRFWRFDANVFDPMLLRFVGEFVRPGDTVFDIGANVGLFAFAAAQRAGRTGRVVAVDADVWLASLLQRSASLANRDEAPVSVVCGAVAEQAGLLSFSIAARGRASNFLTDLGGNSQTGGSRHTMVVVATTIDALAGRLGGPTVVKIDVEGAESLVLEGAAAVLTRDRPVMLCEVGAERAEDVGKRLASHEYVMFDAERNGRGHRVVSKPVFNTIACPRERLGDFPSLTE